jgi:hypothetical protein
LAQNAWTPGRAVGSELVNADVVRGRMWCIKSHRTQQAFFFSKAREKVLVRFTTQNGLMAKLHILFFNVSPFP